MQSKKIIDYLLMLGHGLTIVLFSIIILFLTFDISKQVFLSALPLHDDSQILRNFVDNNPDKSNQNNLFGIQTEADLSVLSVGTPVRLRIPAISIDSVIENVGLGLDGTVGTPKNQDDVAWFNFGQRPGEIGSAIIDGHYGWKDNKGSVFDNLYKLRKGDKISVEDDKGSIASFVVRDSKRYNANEEVADVFDSNDGISHLNLITCEGDWNNESQSYSKRLVVFADKEQ